MNNNIGRMVLAGFVVVVVGGLGYVAMTQNPISENNQPLVGEPQNLPTSCTDVPEGTPVITSLSSYSGSIGAMLEIHGCNFSGFEGDKIATIENSQGMHANIGGGPGSTSKLLKITLASPLCEQDNSYSGLPCTSWLTLTPGTYKIYTMPWGKKSNEVMFTIQ